MTVLFESLPNWYCFLLRHYKRPFIKSTDYLFQLVSVTVSTCSKKERNKRKQLPLGGKSLSIGTKFPIKFVSTNFSEGFQFLLGVMSFFVKIGLRIISIMVTTSKRNSKILKNTISARQKRILQFLFPLVHTIIEIRENQFLKITFFLPAEIRGNPIFKCKVILARHGF